MFTWKRRSIQFVHLPSKLWWCSIAILSYQTEYVWNVSWFSVRMYRHKVFICSYFTDMIPVFFSWVISVEFVAASFPQLWLFPGAAHPNLNALPAGRGKNQAENNNLQVGSLCRFPILRVNSRVLLAKSGKKCWKLTHLCPQGGRDQLRDQS